jgi:putative peptidoglycan lipid II flippase
VALFILSTPLITTLFYYGAFTAHDVQMTHYAVMAYSIGLVGLIIVKILAPAFYAQQNIKTPVKIALFTLLCTQFMNLLFIGFFQHAGLALAIGLGACVNASLLLYFLRKTSFFILDQDWPVFLFKLLISLVILAVVLLFLRGSNDAWVYYSFFEKLKFLSIAIIFGGFVYFLSLWLLGIKLKQFIKQTN